MNKHWLTIHLFCLLKTKPMNCFYPRKSFKNQQDSITLNIIINPVVHSVKVKKRKVELLEKFY